MLIKWKQLNATFVCETEAILICVPTPLDDHREPDLSFVIDTAHTIAPHLPKGGGGSCCPRSRLLILGPRRTNFV